MQWIRSEEKFPEGQRILVSDGHVVFICEWIESKWGNHYRCTEPEDYRWIEWTHWMEIPKPPDYFVEE